MNLSSVGATLTAETNRQTLEKVNINLLKQSNEQQKDLNKRVFWVGVGYNWQMEQ